MNNNKAFIYGLLFGLISPLIGIFAGLQLSSILGNILMFPFYIVGMFTDLPFGNWSMLIKIMGILFSMITWGTIFYMISRLTIKHSLIKIRN